MHATQLGLKCSPRVPETVCIDIGGGISVSWPVITQRKQCRMIKGTCSEAGNFLAVGEARRAFLGLLVGVLMYTCRQTAKGTNIHRPTKDTQHGPDHAFHRKY